MTNNGHITANLGAYQPALMEGLETLRDERIIERELALGRATDHERPRRELEVVPEVSESEAHRL